MAPLHRGSSWRHPDPWHALERGQTESEPPDPGRADGDPGGPDGIDRDETVAELDQRQERRRWSPPPRYPQANPLELTMSIVSSVVRSGRNAS